MNVLVNIHIKKFRNIGLCLRLATKGHTKVGYISSVKV